MTAETLYPHEVVIKWFKNHKEILVALVISTIMLSVLVYIINIIVNAVNSAPTLDSSLIQSNTTVYITSCSLPIPSLLLIVFVLSVFYYGIRICSPGWGLSK